MTTAQLPAKTEAPFTIAPITYPVYKAEIAAMAAEYMELTVESIDDKQGIADVREARIKFKNARVAIEKRRKELKAESLEYGKMVDSAAKELTAIIAPTETYLEHQEGIVERHRQQLAKEAEEKRIAKVQSRLAILRQVEALIPVDEVAIMTDEKFAEVVESHRVTKQERDNAAAAAAIERERVAQEQRIEADRLAKERAELDRQREEQAAAQAKIDAENKRIADEQAAKERAIELEKAKADAAEKARRDAIAEQKRKEVAAKSKAAAAEAELRRLESLRPDHEKLLTVATCIELIEVPDVSDGAKGTASRIRDVLIHAARDVRGFCDELTKAAAGRD